MPDPKTGKNRIEFLVDPDTGLGILGHGDAENAGFLRNDPTHGLSVIAVIVLTDEDDCSASDTRPFNLPNNLSADDPLQQQGLNVRCHYNQQALYPVERYVEGFKALRPTDPNLVIFAAITGVPINLVDQDAIAKVDFTKQASRDAFYDGILNDSRMIEQVDDRGTPNVDDDKLVHSCNGDNGATADPPRRIVQVARGFGENGIVQSICQQDYGPALDTIIALIAKRLTSVCLPRPLVCNDQGLVACNVVWELPPPQLANPDTTPTRCGAPGFEFLLPPDQGGATTTRNGGAICRVAQLAVKDDPSQPGTKHAVPTTTDGAQFADGWYYDDFSPDTKMSCPGSLSQRVAFSPNAHPPNGVTVKLECLNEAQGMASNRTDVATGSEPSIGSPCDQVTRNGHMLEGDAACEVRLNAPTAQWPDGVDRSLFCHPQAHVCVLGCNTDADCPPAWVCDDKRPETLAATARPGHENGTAICVNPTCGDQ